MRKLHGKINQKKRTKIYNEFRSLTLGKDGNTSNAMLLTTDLAARGIDIPDVDWIIQLDPPQWSDQFVHRIGRTARAGRQGQSLLFLTENESPYTAYLKQKSVEFEPESVIPEIEDIEEECKELRERMQNQMLKDKDLIDKSQDAFVSFIRYYKEHQLQFIFAFNALSIGQVANSFFLFKLPRIKEILGKPVRDFVTRTDLDLTTVIYRDTNQGKQFEQRVQKRKEKFDAKQVQKEKVILTESKSQKLKQSSTSARKRHRKEVDWQEWDDLAEEIREMKKEKKLGKKKRKALAAAAEAAEAE